MERVKFLIKGFVTNLVFSAILFVCAGRVNYPQAWLFLFVNLLATLMNYFTIHKNSELMSERSKPGEGIKSWDKLLLALSALVYLFIIITAGLDSGRFNGQTGFNGYISLPGLILMLTGQVVFLTARSQNQFFSSVVRIQKDRGHQVCDRGLYKLVRHPGYLGMTLSLMSLPLITSSVWSIIPTSLAIVLLWVRTSLEDKTLCLELGGYSAYTKKTPYKLIPLVW